MSLPPRSFFPRYSTPGYSLRFRGIQQRRGLLSINFGGPSGPGNSGRSRWPIILSAFLGGATATAVGGYTFYHWSGLKTAVGAIQHPIEFYRQHRNTRKAQIQNGEAVLVDGVQLDTATQILAVLRDLTKIYVSPIPGATILVDLAFDEIQKVVDVHKDEARVILVSTFDEVKEAMKARGEGSKQGAWDVLTILRVKLGQIQALASATGQDKIGPLFERFPGFHEHATRHISGVRDTLLPVYQKGLEKGKDVLSGLSRRLPMSSPKMNPSAADDISVNSHSQEQSQAEDHSDGSKPSTDR